MSDWKNTDSKNIYIYIYKYIYSINAVFMAKISFFITISECAKAEQMVNTNIKISKRKRKKEKEKKEIKHKLMWCDFLEQPKVSENK